MVVIGCNFHPSRQQVSWMDQYTGETGHRKLSVVSGADGHSRTRSADWRCDAAKIRASDARQQKHDKRDAQLLLKLLREGRFPQIWTASSQEKDLRQLLIHRYKLVRIRAQET